MNTPNSLANRRNITRVITFVYLILLVMSKIGAVVGIIANTQIFQNVWWTALLLFGAMITGFLFQPMVKTNFPGLKDPRGTTNPNLNLKDHETLMGYYPVVALVLFIGALALSPILYGEQIILDLKSSHFFWSILGTGILNVGIFYFLTKGMRYGDVSLVSVTWALSPVFVLPISIIVYQLIGASAPIGNPSVSAAGFAGIIIAVAAVALSVLANKRKPPDEAPKGDFFANHPVASGILATVIASVAVNFDKVAIDSANPFLAGIVMSLVVVAITLGWTLKQGGIERMRFVFKSYWREFLRVGLVYGAVILVMNVALFGANVNYYASIKRAAAIFGTFYGIYVLREGQNTGEKLLRIGVAVAVIIGIVLITLKG